MRRSLRGDRVRRLLEARARLLAEELRRDYLRAMDTLGETLTATAVERHLATGTELVSTEQIVRALGPWRRTLRDGVETAGDRA